MKAGSRLARLIGTSPINPLLFAIGKLALATSLVLPLIQLFGLRIWRQLPQLVPIAVLLGALGLAILAVAALSLGSSIRVGLPTEPTTLKTTGIYRFSRHPIYLAFFLLCLASCLYVPHPVVIASGAIAVLVHHKIALAEESFLEKRFGAAWLSYRSRVPRYFGLPREA